ncbi:SGNH/GDSL hydrolase family protein [Arthrobacter wenxiniae]|jgi:lysophospholipase L1-like esterase|uniref:SGNH/GDSL hydrolase family protein n=1 Tax=Arthrobacter wenxiniae TaxID=2713570 RepID=A0A7Y7IFF1_9MICC|nr:SGNH/GDSL hydrolase family protein [Arthrobacter wenxiniae]NVM94490.1 SGNH/GDSL hydrolase family protein [Arthrobacter wenxiniae]
MYLHRLRIFAARTGVAALMSLGLIAGIAGAPATAQSAPPVTYTVLGDSYSAGTGGGAESLPCLQSPNGYGNDYAAATHQAMVNLACYGATAAQVQALQVPLIPATTRLITLTVGGNDIGTGDVSAACVAAPQSSTCTAALQASLEKLTKLPAQLKSLIRAVKAKAPRAKIAFLGYPELFEPANMAALGYPAAQVAAAKTMNGAAELLNGTIAWTALTNGARFVPVSWAFAGHGIPSASQWIVGPGDANPFVFHPTAAGYLNGYTAALRLFL